MEEQTTEGEEFGGGASSHQLDLELPSDYVLISIQRGRRLVIPHGDTVLQPGDRVTALVDTHHRELFQSRFEELDPRRLEELERKKRAEPFAEV